MDGWLIPFIIIIIRVIKNEIISKERLERWLLQLYCYLKCCGLDLFLVSKIIADIETMCGHFLFSIFVSILFLAASTQEVNSDGTVVKVKVKQGWVSGIRDQWQNKKVVYKFINVPYALPPLGERRFKVRLIINIMILFCRDCRDSSKYT